MLRLGTIERAFLGEYASTHHYTSIKGLLIVMVLGMS